MFRNYLLIATRTLTKNRLFSLINISGLAVGIGCVMVIYLYMRNELTYDQFHIHRDNLYILGEGNREGGDENEAGYYSTVFPALPAMLDEFPEVENGVRFFNWEQHILIANNKNFLHQVLYVDTGFFNVFTFPLQEGHGKTALQKKDGIVISEAIAKKLFNTTAAIGQVIAFEDDKVFTVTGVLEKIPANSSFQPEVLISLVGKAQEDPLKDIGDWYNSFTEVVIKLAPNADIEQLRAKLPAFVKQHYAPGANERTLKAYPFTAYHDSVAGNKTFIYGLGCIGAGILLLAVINFINLSIASSLNRLRETGLRKIMGSAKYQIVFQFFTEATLLSLVAVMLSFGMVQLILPSLNKLLEMSLSLNGRVLPEVITLAAAVAVFIGLVAGGYPALYLASFKPVSAVRGIIPNIQNRLSIRNTLVVVQFVISLAMIGGTLVVTRQIHYMKTADLKFDKENVLVADLNSGFKDEKTARSSLLKIVNGLNSDSRIVATSLAGNVPGRYWENYNGFIPAGGTEPVSLRQASVDEGYLDTYSINLLEGRNFSVNIAADTTNTVAMINKAAMDALGWKTAVGKTLRPAGGNNEFTVIGVMDDFHYRSLQGSIQPLIHFYLSPRQQKMNSNFLSLKIAPRAAPQVLKQLEDEWRSLDSWLGFNYFFIDEEFDKQYKSVERTLWLVSFFAGAAILISCTGVFALSAIAVKHRIKEIGIRKVLGASVTSIVRLLSGDFLKLYLIAIVLGSPLAWYGMDRWLRDFAYHTDPGWAIFVLAGVFTLLTGLLAMSLQTVKAGLNNPVDALRNE